MKILLFCYGESGLISLQELIKNKLNIIFVFLSPHEGEELKNYCKKNAIPFEIFDAKIAVHKINKLNPDLIVISSFPKLLSEKIITIPKLGTINLHASKLPKYRGYHPLNWAIIRGEKEIGVTVHYVDKNMDSGDILTQRVLPFRNTDDINTIKRKVLPLGAKLLIQTIKKIKKAKKRIKGTPQNLGHATLAPKRSSRDGKIDWNTESRNIFNLVRALKSPYPNAYALNKKGDKILFEESFLSKPGAVVGKIKEYYVISTADGVILLKTKQSLIVGETLK